MSEHDIQCAVIDWAAWNAGEHPELRMLFAIPNGGMRNVVTAMRLKREGVKRGVPDLFLPCPRGGYHGLFLEMKNGKKGRISEPQSWYIQKLTEQGYMVAVCGDDKSAIEALSDYLRGKLKKD